MQVLLFLFKSAPALVLIGCLAAFLNGAVNAALIAIVHQAVTAPRLSWTLLAAFAALVLGKLVTGYLSEMVLLSRSQQSVAELRYNLIRRLLAVPLRRFEIAGRQRVYSTLAEDVSTINSALFSLPGFAVSGAVVAGGGVYLMYLSWRALLALALLMLIGAAFYNVVSRRAWDLFESTRNEYDRLYKHFGALTEGAKELKLHRGRRLAFVDGQVKPTTEALMRFHVAAYSSYFRGRVVSNLFFFGVVGAILFMMPNLRDAGSYVISGYILTCLYLMGPVGGVVRTWPIFVQAEVALARVRQLGLDLGANVEETDSAPESPASFSRIELRAVTHSYGAPADAAGEAVPGRDVDSSFTLGPVDLEFGPGELVFITGGNGSGKSTLAKVLSGLYSPEAGEVRWDGRPVTDGNRDAYRQLFSAVFSDFYLFESLLGLSGPDLDKRAEKLIREFLLGHKVKVSEGVLSSLDLSHGQRKRLALLTAYLEDRPIYLLDEWAAEQDPNFKDIFYNKMLAELKAGGKTVILITQDDRYFHLADRMLTLREGRMA